MQCLFESKDGHGGCVTVSASIQSKDPSRYFNMMSMKID